MDDDPIQAYSDARVEGAKTLAEAYDHCGRDPSAFVAGVQYALDKILGGSERYYNIPWPTNAMGDVVSVRTLHTMGLDILERAKRGEPQ